MTPLPEYAPGEFVKIRLTDPWGGIFTGSAERLVFGRFQGWFDGQAVIENAMSERSLIDAENILPLSLQVAAA